MAKRMLCGHISSTSPHSFLGRVKWSSTGGVDIGWRGPALLLRLDADEGTAVVQHQGRPYLVSLRHVREHRGIYGYTQAEEAVVSLMKHAENLAPYHVQLMGHLCKRSPPGDQWHQIPKDLQEREAFSKAVELSKALATRTLGGVMFGKAIRSLKPPAETTGILITWIQGARDTHFRSITALTTSR